MYCSNCAKPINDQATVCVGCGVPVGAAQNFCTSCAYPIQAGASVCVQCGVPVAATAASGAKSKMTAGLLAIFLGCFGVHNFYLGYSTKAIIQVIVGGLGFLLSLPTLGISVFVLMIPIEIWGVVEGILILTGKTDKDGKGNKLAP